MTPKSTILSGQIPKYGTLIPNRVFVGGISSVTSENELKQFFSAYGSVKDCKIIVDRAGISKSYGFVTFETQEDAERIIKKERDNLFFRDRKLNVGPAIRKQQPFPKLYADPNLSPVSGSTIIYHNGLTYSVPNGMTIYCHPDGYLLPAQPQTPMYPVMVTPQSYVPRASCFSSPPSAPAPAQWTSASGQWRWIAPQNSSASMVNSPYLYPFQTMVSPDAAVYGSNSQVYQPNPELNECAVVDPSSVEYYYGAQYQNTALC